MIDLVCIFSAGGEVLWYMALCDLQLEFLNILIKKVLLEERQAESVFRYQNYTFKWRIFKELQLYFACVYQETTSLMKVEDLLKFLEEDFTRLFPLERSDGLYPEFPDYSERFQVVLKLWDEHKQALAAPKQMRSFGETKKAGKVKKKDNEGKKEAEATKHETTKEPEDDGNAPGSPTTLTGKEKLKQKFGKKPTGSPLKKTVTPDAPPKKEMRQSMGIKDTISKRDLDRVEKSTTKGELGSQKELDALHQKYVEIDEEDPLDQRSKKVLTALDRDKLELNFEQDKHEEKKTGGGSGLFARLASKIQDFTGNKEMTEEALAPVLKDFAERLMGKNVAHECALALNESVRHTLLQERTKKFTSVKKTVGGALVQSISNLLTPQKELDILKEALAAQQKGRVFKVVFIGVNGVGKSTSLAKTAYLLKKKGGLRVMLAACDNFRSGAVEQLATHARCLDVPLYEKGYKDDPANIAKQAIQEAKRKSYDVVLIDTAGRMQDNEPLMRALAKLVHHNSPDAILFVGEALVGNDAIDQLTKFNQALIDFAEPGAEVRTIDGIVLTKFDTVDDKVGAALSMVYTTGRPIVYVGVGQKYPHLRKLNVNAVVNALLA